MIGVLGLGEAGGAIAAALREAGATVRGFDPDPATNPDAADTAQAVTGAELVLSLTTAEEARGAALAAAPYLTPGQIYADANTSGPALKRELAELVAPASFADVALMSPVRGLATPALACGPGALRAAEILSGMPITVLDGEPGTAATRKLLRSVAWKGVAAAVCEALAAARAAGVEPWMHEELATLLASEDVRRMEEGSRRHAARRAHEMADVAALLRELGITPYVADAARAQLEDLRG